MRIRICSYKKVTTKKGNKATLLRLFRKGMSSLSFDNPSYTSSPSPMDRIIIIAAGLQQKERIVKTSEGWTYTPSERYNQMYEKSKLTICEQKSL